MTYASQLEYLNFNRVFIHITWETIPNAGLYCRSGQLNKIVDAANAAHQLQDIILDLFGIQA